MYSYEDRILTVKLFIKLGKRTGATIRQLSFPTKNSLKSWHAEDERCLDLPRGYETRSRSTHRPKGKKLSGTISNTVATLPLPSRRWATRAGFVACLD